MFDAEPMASLALLILSGLTLLVLRWFHVRAVAGLAGGGVSRQMANIIFLVAMGHVGLFMLLPAVLRPVTAWVDDQDLGIARSEIVYVYLIEIVSFAVWAAGFLLVWRGRWLRAVTHGEGRRDEKMDREARVFLCLVLALGMWRTIDTIGIGSTAVFAQDEASFGARWGWLIGTIAWASGTVVGPYVLVLGRAKVGPVLWLFALSGFVVFAATAGSGGARGAAIWPLVWCLLLIGLYRKRREWFRLALPVLAVLVPLLLFHEYYQYFMGTSTRSGVGLVDRLAALGGEEAKVSDPIESTAGRLGCASRYSVGFIRLWESGRGAYWNPIVNTLPAPLPRRFFPNKPWPTSLNGDEGSSGMYICVAQFTLGQNYTMSEFLTGSHAYWEFGCPGVVGLSLAGGMLLAAIASLLCRMGLAGPALIFFFFKPWGYNNPKLWFSDLMLEIVQVGPISLLLWKGARFLTRNRTKSVLEADKQTSSTASG